MADFKVSGITPAVGNIKYNESNVKEIYMGSTKVWPFNSEPPVPDCVDRVLVFQICNENGVRDDNFNVYLNAFDWADRDSVLEKDLNNYIGTIDQNCSVQCANMFIGSTDTSVTVFSTDVDFPCPLNLTTQKHFDPSLLRGGENTLFLENVQTNGRGNDFDIQVRNYLLDENGNLTDPLVISNIEWNDALNFDRTLSSYPNGPSGGRNVAFKFNFDTCGEGISTFLINGE